GARAGPGRAAPPSSFPARGAVGDLLVTPAGPGHDEQPLGAQLLALPGELGVVDADAVVPGAAVQRQVGQPAAGRRVDEGHRAAAVPVADLGDVLPALDLHGRAAGVGLQRDADVEVGVGHHGDAPAGRADQAVVEALVERVARIRVAARVVQVEHDVGPLWLGQPDGLDGPDPGPVARGGGALAPFLGPGLLEFLLLRGLAGPEVPVG